MVADELETTISRRTSRPIAVRRVVIITHERCDIGQVRAPEVDAILKLDEVSPVSIFGGHSYDLKPQDVSKVVEAITGGRP